MSEQKNVKAGLVQVIKFQRCEDEHVYFQLRGAGLVKRIGTDVVPRNLLYTEYFGKRLNG